jgi:hypothetical protein
MSHTEHTCIRLSFRGTIKQCFYYVFFITQMYTLIKLCLIQLTNLVYHKEDFWRCVDRSNFFCYFAFKCIASKFNPGRPPKIGSQQFFVGQLRYAKPSFCLFRPFSISFDSILCFLMRILMCVRTNS